MRLFSALSHPQRIRILATLARGRRYVSELAREVGLSRPLLYMHLQRLEGVGLIAGSLEVSTEGKAMKFFSAVPFAFQVSLAQVAAAATSITTIPPKE